MRNITICITNDILYDRRILRIARSLSQQYKVKIISRNIHRQHSEFQYFTNSYINPWFKKGFLFYMEYNLRLFFKLLFHDVDCIYAVDYDTLIPSVMAGQLKRKQIVLDAHEFFEESVEIVGRPAVQRFWKWVGKTFVPKINFGLSVSASIAKIYSEKFQTPFHLIRNLPVYSESSEQIIPSDKKIILYQGVLNEGRKLEWLIEAASFLSEDYQIWIIGEGDISQELRQQQNSLETRCEVIFYSWIKPDRLVEYTQQAFLGYNLLEDSSPSYYYSLANKFFDYVHAGVPSLNCNFPEYSVMEHEYNCCYCFNPGSAKELADFILNLDVNEYQLKRENSLKARKVLNWQNEEKSLLQLFQSALE